MIDFKKAAQIAAQYLQDLFSNEKISNIMLEEVERVANDERNGYLWHITLSYTTDVQRLSLYPELFKARTYKTFIIDDEGSVLAMKIRELQS